MMTSASSVGGADILSAAGMKESKARKGRQRSSDLRKTMG
jgi:hypothetical protein